MTQQISISNYFSVNKKAFQVGDKLNFELFINKENKKNIFAEVGHVFTRNDRQTLMEIEKVFIHTVGVENYKNFIKIKKIAIEIKKKNAQVSKSASNYLSVNKKAFQRGDKSNFDLFINKENEKNLFTEVGHIFTRDDIRTIRELEKVFIHTSGVKNYKNFIKIKKEAIKAKKTEGRVDTASDLESNYIAVNKKSFQTGDTLKFELYINQEDQKILLTNIGRIITKNDKKILLENEKVFVHKVGIDSYNDFIKLKQEVLKAKERSVDIDYIIPEIKNILTEIFTNSNSTKNIQKLYPLVKDFTQLLIEKNLQFSNLKNLITKDYTTATHSLNVSIYAALIAREIKLSNHDLQDLILSGILHDIGKTEISDKILDKITELNNNDYKEIKKHSTLGVIMAKKSGMRDKNILSGIHHHHERLDGSGYPNGFKNEHVSLFARIIGICDTFDAMTTNRLHQDSQKAFDIIIDMKKTMKNTLDNELIGSLIKVITSQTN